MQDQQKGFHSIREINGKNPLENFICQEMKSEDLRWCQRDHIDGNTADLSTLIAKSKPLIY